MVHHSFFVYYSKKIEKVQEHDIYLNQIQHHLILKKIPRKKKKIYEKEALLLFIYEVVAHATWHLSPHLSQEQHLLLFSLKLVYKHASINYRRP